MQTRGSVARNGMPKGINNKGFIEPEMAHKLTETSLISPLRVSICFGTGQAEDFVGRVVFVAHVVAERSLFVAPFIAPLRAPVEVPAADAVLPRVEQFNGAWVRLCDDKASVESYIAAFVLV